MQINNENNKDNQEKNDIVEKLTPTMILTIDIGNKNLEKLNIYDIENPEQDIYNFCLKNKLDFNILKEIKNQIQILISQNIYKNIGQNQINNLSKNSSQLNELSNNDKNIKYQNFINNSDNLTETNFNTNQLNNIEDLNIFEMVDNNKYKIISKSNSNNNLKKYYNKISNYNTNNIKDTKKIIRHKMHKSKIEELDKEIEIMNKNDIINNNLYTNNSSSFFISPSFNTSNHNPNFALRNYFSKEEDNYFTENNPYFGNNNNIKRNKNNKSINKSMSLNGIYSKNFNPWKDLYERNLKYNEEKKEKLKILKKNLESDQDEDNTFSPKINKISKTQNEHRKMKKLEYSNPDIIKNYKKYKEDKIKYLKEKQEKELEKNYTFKPIINGSTSTFKNVCKKYGSKLVKDISCLNNFNNENDKKSSSKNKNKEANKNINNKNYKNENNLKENSKNKNRFEKLYNERFYIKENQNKLRQKIYKEFSFKPKINRNSTYMKLDKPFKERLKTYSNKTRENMIKIKKQYEREKGLDNSFKPALNTKKNKELLRQKKEIINKSTNNNNSNKNNTRFNNIHTQIYVINQNTKNKKRRINNKSFSNNLIINTNEYKNRIKKLNQYSNLFLYKEKNNQEKNILNQNFYKSHNKSPMCCNNSEKIVNKKREHFYKKIFHILDSDEDNKITTEHINILGLPIKIQKIMEPIFTSLEEENESLNEIEFIYVCKQLYNDLSYIEKREFMSYVEDKNNYKKEKKIYNNDNYTFKPKINKRNNSYEKLGIAISGDVPTSHLFVENFERANNNFAKHYFNLKNSAEIEKKGIFFNNYFYINSGHEKNKMKKIDDTYKNNSLNKNLNFSKNCINNKYSFINNGNKNYQIKSTSATNKEKNLNDYFNLKNKKKYSQLKNI